MEIIIAIVAGACGFGISHFLSAKTKRQSIQAKHNELILLPRIQILSSAVTEHGKYDTLGSLWYLCGEQVEVKASASSITPLVLPSFDVQVKYMGPNSLLLENGQRFDISVRCRFTLRAPTTERQDTTHRVRVTDVQPYGHVAAKFAATFPAAVPLWSTGSLRLYGS